LILGFDPKKEIFNYQHVKDYPRFMNEKTGVEKRIDWLLGSFFLFVLFFILLSAGRGEGAVLTVDDDPGGGDFSSIQDAIDAAEDGDTIRVYEYYRQQALRPFSPLRYEESTSFIQSIWCDN